MGNFYPIPLLWLLPILLILAEGSCAFAQSATPASPIGKRFLVVLPDTIRATIGPYNNPARQDAWLAFFADDTARVKVTAPGYSRELIVIPDSARTLQLLDPTLPAPRPFIDRVNTPTKDIFTIESDVPISVICYFTTHSGSEAFLPLPVESWGNDYFAMALRVQFFFDVGFEGADEEKTFQTNAPAQIVVIASENATDVTVSATVDLIGPRDTTFRLDAGEAYLIETADFWTRDTNAREISGTRITATKPIGVISGNTRTQGGAGANIVASPTGNSVNNTAVEWLAPANAHGSTFIYRPVAPLVQDSTEELIRVYATSPGTTIVSLSNGFAPATLEQGEYVTYSHSLYPKRIAAGSFTTPFAIRTDKPAQAMVITGSRIRALPQVTIGDHIVVSSSPTMSLLPPRESWINSGRFQSPLYPPYLKHHVVVAADSGAEVWIDGVEVTAQMAAVPGVPFMHGGFEVTAGDHSIRCVNGTCGAIAFGQGEGTEGFEPLGIKEKDDNDGTIASSGGGNAPRPLHPSTYFEDISVAYAYPVPGRAEEELPADSLIFQRLDKCDSTVVTVTRIGPAWTFLPYTIEPAPGSTNVDMRVVSIWGGSVAGYRIRLAPIDPDRDAEGPIILTNAAGRRWEIPYSYKAHALAASPQTIDLLDVKINEEQIIPITLTNQKPFVVTVISIRLKTGGAGFSEHDLSQVGRSLANGDAITISLAFSGATKNSTYLDTLIVETDCRTFMIPLRARTGPYPIPLITGKDWKEREVGSINDSVSIVSNAGSAAYTIREIVILDDPDGAFSLVSPDWRAIPPLPPVTGRDSVGIRFLPPSMGEFIATIALVTTDNDTARAELRGIGIMPVIAAPDIDAGIFCLNDTLDTTAFIINEGNTPLHVGSLDLTAGTEAELTIDTIAPFLPKTILPGDTLRLPLRIAAKSPGAWSATIRLRSDARVGDSLVLITGTISTCVRPTLAIDDHDFDSVFITLTKPGIVTIRNLGGGDATVTNMMLAGDAEGAFRILWPHVPFIVPDGDTVQIACEFTPPTVGLKSARIEVESDAGPLTSQLRGVGKKLIVPALIRRDYHAEPGEEVTIFLELKGRLDTVPVQRLDIAIGYQPQLLDLLAIRPDSASAKGWRHFGGADIDTIRYSIEVGTQPPDTGALLAMRFLTRFDPLDRSELPFTIETGLPYVEIVEEPGLFTRDPICGLIDRLFTFLPNSFRLEQNLPNPLTGDGTIEFQIPFESRTTLIIYDALGGEAFALIDRVIPAGVYSAHIPAGTLAPGLYYYRLTAGEFTTMRKMIVQ